MSKEGQAQQLAHMVKGFLEEFDWNQQKRPQIDSKSIHTYQPIIQSQLENYYKNEEILLSNEEIQRLILIAARVIGDGSSVWHTRFGYLLETYEEENTRKPF